MDRLVDALVIGGGPAGAAVGTLLAQAGRSVEVVETTAAAQDKMCGEFLSDEAIRYLRRLGVDPAELGAATASKVRLARRELIGESALPFTGMGLKRKLLDEALLARTRQAGACVLRGHRVEELRRSDGHWIARLADGGERRAATVLLATGKHDLRGWMRPAGKQNDLVAFKMYFRLAEPSRAAIHGNVELVLFPGGYGGLLLLERHVLNLCVLVQRSALRHLGRWPDLLRHMQTSSPYLARYLEGAEPLLEQPLALSSIPYGYLCESAPDGLWRLGDQAAVIPSFSGDGISIALHSAHLAAAEYLAGRSADEYQRRLCAQLRRPVGTATMLSRLMVAAPLLGQGIRLWPKVLSAITRQTRVPSSALRL